MSWLERLWKRRVAGRPGGDEPAAVPVRTVLPNAALVAVLDSLVRGVVVVDRSLRPVFANTSARSLLGIHPGEEFALSGDQGAELRELLAQSLRLGGRICRDISSGGCGIRAEVYRFPAGGDVLALALLSDTSVEAQVEERYRLTAGDVAHDLRAPAAAIECCVEDLLDGKASDPDVLTARLNTIRNESRRVALLAEDVLHFTALASGRVKMSLEVCSLPAVAESCLASMSMAAERAGVRLAARFDAATPAVFGDVLRIRQALTNLLANAVNHTPSGGSVTVWSEEAGDLLRLCVTDTGCGISPQDMDRLWDRFFRAATAGPQRQGTGLGLPIVKRIAGLHGGDVGVSSTPGEGSTFWISLPRYRPQD